MILLHSCSPCQCSRRAVRWSQGSSALSHQGSPPLPSYPSAPCSHTLLLNIQTIHWFRPPLILCVHLSHSASTVTRNWQELLGSFLFWLQYSLVGSTKSVLGLIETQAEILEANICSESPLASLQTWMELAQSSLLCSRLLPRVNCRHPASPPDPTTPQTPL